MRFKTKLLTLLLTSSLASSPSWGQSLNYPDVDPSIENQTALSVLCVCVTGVLGNDALFVGRDGPLTDDWRIKTPFFVRPVKGAACARACSVVHGRCVSGVAEVYSYTPSNNLNSNPDAFEFAFVGPINASVKRVSKKECS